MLNRSYIFYYIEIPSVNLSFIYFLTVVIIRDNRLFVVAKSISPICESEKLVAVAVILLTSRNMVKLSPNVKFKSRKRLI